MLFLRSARKRFLTRRSDLRTGGDRYFTKCHQQIQSDFDLRHFLRLFKHYLETVWSSGSVLSRDTFISEWVILITLLLSSLTGDREMICEQENIWISAHGIRTFLSVSVKVLLFKVFILRIRHGVTYTEFRSFYKDRTFFGGKRSWLDNFSMTKVFKGQCSRTALLKDSFMTAFFF